MRQINMHYKYKVKLFIFVLKFIMHALLLLILITILNIKCSSVSSTVIQRSAYNHTIDKILYDTGSYGEIEVLSFVTLMSV